MKEQVNILCVTNRHSVKGDFLKHIDTLLQSGVYGLILREKDLSKLDFKKLACDVNTLCIQHKTPLFLNARFEDFFPHTLLLAQELACGIQTSFENYMLALKENSCLKNSSSITLGVSIHSLQEANFIIENFSTLPLQHVIVGHIFETKCKEGTAGRGLEFLENTTKCFATVPQVSVFAIGGINPERTPDILKRGAQGIALMSSLMESENPHALLAEFQK